MNSIMRKATAVFCGIIFIFAVSCQNNVTDIQSGNPSQGANLAVNANGQLRDTVKAMCGENYISEFKEKSMIGDMTVDVFSLRGEPKLNWLFAFDSHGNFYIDRNANGNWQNICISDDGNYYIGKSAVTTHTEDEYILFIESLSDDIFSPAEDREITADGQDIIDGNLLKKYKIAQNGITVGAVAVNDILDVAYISRGDGGFEIFTGDLSKYQAKG